jgi:hypothetical protein
MAPRYETFTVGVPADIASRSVNLGPILGMCSEQTHWTGRRAVRLPVPFRDVVLVDGLPLTRETWQRLQQAVTQFGGDGVL